MNIELHRCNDMLKHCLVTKGSLLVTH